MIDLLDQLSYLKNELPSQRLRQSSINLQNNNKPRYRGLVNLGYKMVVDVIDTLCPCPSRTHVFNDICVLLGKDGDNVWDSDLRNIKSKCIKLVFALFSCATAAKKILLNKKYAEQFYTKGLQARN